MSSTKEKGWTKASYMEEISVNLLDEEYSGLSYTFFDCLPPGNRREASLAYLADR